MSITGFLFSIAPKRVGNLGEKSYEKPPDEPLLPHDHAIDGGFYLLDGGKNLFLIDVVLRIHQVHANKLAPKNLVAI
jgi:hypothetical protein